MSGPVHGVHIEDRECALVMNIFAAGISAVERTNGGLGREARGVVDRLQGHLKTEARAYARSLSMSSNGDRVDASPPPGESVSEDDVLLTTKAVADVLGVTQHHVAHLIRTGQLPATMTGRQWLIAESAVDELLARRTM